MDLMKGTTEEIIQRHLDSIGEHIHVCNIKEFARELNFISGYLQYQRGREILTEKNFLKYKFDLKEKIDQIEKICECKVRQKNGKKIVN